MAKIKYRYNPETLSYDAITVTAKERLIKWGKMFVASIVISVVYFAIYSRFSDTPKELTLNNKLYSLKFDYQMLMQDLYNVDLILADIQKRDDDIYRTILEAQPIPASIRQAGFGGVNRYEHLEGFDNSNIMIAASRHTDIILKQLYVQSLSYDELIDRVVLTEQMNNSRPAIMPIAYKDLRNMGRYGWREEHPVWRDGRMHRGMDFSAIAGTPIHATGDGTVVSSEWMGGYGWTVVIDHGLVGYHTLYAHMQRKGIDVGTEVKRGQVIGRVGNTGDSTAPHVHYEVHKNGYRNHVNPIRYFYIDFSHDEYMQLIEQAQNSDEVFEDWDLSDDSDPYDLEPPDDLELDDIIILDEIDL